MHAFDFDNVHSWLEEVSFREGQKSIEFSLSLGEFEVLGTYREASGLRLVIRRLRRIYWSKFAQFVGVKSQIFDYWAFHFLGRVEIKLNPDGQREKKVSVDRQLAHRSVRLSRTNEKCVPRLLWTKVEDRLTRYPHCSTRTVATTLSDGQGLGNQLWAISAARVTASKRNLPFSILGAQHFKGLGIFDLDFGDFVPRHLEVQSCRACNETQINEKTANRTNAVLDYSDADPKILSGSDPIHITGNFQSLDYIRGFESQVREWLQPITQIDLPKDVVVIHYRAGDFRGNAHYLPTSYFQKAISDCLQENPLSKFIVISDQVEVARGILKLPESITYDHEILYPQSKDTPLAPHHFGPNLNRDFSLMLSAPRLIIPNSSLSWWAAFLSLPKKAKVYAPKFWDNHVGMNRYWKPEGLKLSEFNFLD